MSLNAANCPNDPAMNGLLVRSANGARRVASKCAEDMLRFAGEFGLTPAARSRISAGVNGEPPHGKFTGLIGGA